MVAGHVEASKSHVPGQTPPVGPRSSAEWAHRECVSCQALRPAAPALQERFGGLPEVELGGGDAGALGTWADMFRLTQGYEAWQALGAWITEAPARLWHGGLRALPDGVQGLERAGLPLCCCACIPTYAAVLPPSVFKLHDKEQVL